MYRFFPAGVPHSIQAVADGVEFLLVFNQGTFSEDGTDLVSEFLLRNPKEVLAKNFDAGIGVVSSFEELQSIQSTSTSVTASDIAAGVHWPCSLWCMPSMRKGIPAVSAASNSAPESSPGAAVTSFSLPVTCGTSL